MGNGNKQIYPYQVSKVTGYVPMQMWKCVMAFD